ncbi:MAG TPA: PAS domain-containing protein [Opitutaceae bacterium]|nr:PAS domain-containing protein [Opitutaceae bacterium]
MAFPIRRRLQLGITAVVAIVIVVIVGAIYAIRAYTASSEATEHSKQTLFHLALTGSYLKDIELNGRGYELSQDPSFIALFDDSIERFNYEVGAVAALTAANPDQQRRVIELKALTQPIIDHVRTLFTQTRDQLSDPANPSGHLVRNRIYEEIRVHGRSLGQEEVARHGIQVTTLKNRGRLALIAVSAGLVLNVALVTGIIQLLRIHFRERENAERSLRTTADQVLDLYNRAPCGYHSLNSDGYFVAINETELAWLGYAREDVIGKLHFSDIIPPKQKPSFIRNFALLKKEGSLKGVEYDIVRKDGTRFPALINSEANFDASGSYLSNRTTVFDISERKRSETLTELARAYSESIVDTLYEPILILTSDLRVNSANPAFYRFFGFTPANTLGKPLSDLTAGYDDAEGFQRTVQHVCKTGVPVRGKEKRLTLPDEQQKFVLIDISILTGLESRDRLVLISMQDISASKHAHEELEAFSYSVSHDLRAPLRHIAGFADMLTRHLNGKVDDKAVRYLQTITQSARFMGQLIDDLLLFSRINRVEMLRQTVSLNDLVQDVIQSFSPEISSRKITWELNPLPPVEGDLSLLRQVFANLIGNAIKYTRKKPEAEVRIGVDPGQARANEVVIFVADNGAGFDMRYVEKLFGVFQRLHSANEFEGTGVGLANVRRMIQRHGGRVWGTGKLNEGATFYISLPCKVEPSHGNVT